LTTSPSGQSDLGDTGTSASWHIPSVPRPIRRVVLKRILGLGKLCLRGPSEAKDEFLLAATAQNLRKLAKLIALPAAIFAS
jgi:hypothetical protein